MNKWRTNQIKYNWWIKKNVKKGIKIKKALCWVKNKDRVGVAVTESHMAIEIRCSFRYFHAYRKGEN